MIDLTFTEVDDSKFRFTATRDGIDVTGIVSVDVRYPYREGRWVASSAPDRVVASNGDLSHAKRDDLVRVLYRRIRG
jgi:hypothetical protein